MKTSIKHHQPKTKASTRKSRVRRISGKKGYNGPIYNNYTSFRIVTSLCNKIKPKKLTLFSKEKEILS